MYKEILYPEQLINLKILHIFSDDFYLAGGTAIALQIGHRKSIDFDLFSNKTLQITHIVRTLQKNGFQISQILVENKGEEFTCIIGGSKITFLYYPFEIELDPNNTFENIKIPHLNILGAMKLYTLGRRGKWKDYVDIYFLTQTISLTHISELAEKIFSGGYNEKLMREQLCYFEDIDFSEEVEYIGENITQEIIQKSLEYLSIQTQK